MTFREAQPVTGVVSRTQVTGQGQGAARAGRHAVDGGDDRSTPT
jgi:hypothetical protein